MAKKNKGREGLRVKMMIYSGMDDSIVSSDEPLYESADEIMHQADRLQEALENKLYEPEDAGDTGAVAEEGGAKGGAGVARASEDLES